MKSILYLINVNWNWIKQRPHFISENLSEDYLVTVLQKRYLNNPFKNNNLVRNPRVSTSTFRIIDYIQLPNNKSYFIGSRTIIGYLNSFLLWYAKKRIKANYDYVWITSPNIYKNLISMIPHNAKMIYDCMDDYLAFPKVQRDTNLQQLIFDSENELVNQAAITIFSSEYLKNTLQKRYNKKIRSVVVNNAIELPDINNSLNCEKVQLLRNYEKPLVYIGTISEWFDFETVLFALERYQDFDVFLFGPKSCVIPNHPRIHYLGSVSHNEIFPIMSVSYALIMPFVVNDLIKSVNPVKLYEYIYSGKPVLSVRYGETEKFGDFVLLYNGKEEFCQLLQIINEGLIKCNNQRAREFVEANTWRARHRQISTIIESL